MVSFGSELDIEDKRYPLQPFMVGMACWRGPGPGPVGHIPGGRGDCFCGYRCDLFLFLFSGADSGTQSLMHI